MAQGFQGKKLQTVFYFFWPSFSKSDFNTKKTPRNIDVCLEHLGAVLEFWCNERGVTKNHSIDPLEFLKDGF